MQVGKNPPPLRLQKNKNNLEEEIEKKETSKEIFLG